MDGYKIVNTMTVFANYIQTETPLTVDKIDAFEELFSSIPITREDTKKVRESILLITKSMKEAITNKNGILLTSIICSAIDLSANIRENTMVTFETKEPNQELFGFTTLNQIYQTMFIKVREETKQNEAIVKAGLLELFGKNLKWYRASEMRMSVSSLKPTPFHGKPAVVTFVSDVDGKRYPCVVDKVNVKAMNEFITKWFEWFTVEA
jgi:hypothetical protein